MTNDDQTYMTDKSFSLFDANMPRPEDFELRADYLTWTRSKFTDGNDFVAQKVNEFRAIQHQL